MKKTPLILMLALLLSACGFHLRGFADRPEWLTSVAIISKSRNIQLISMLQSQLEGYHIRVYSDPALADYWLIINYIDFQQHIVSIGASTNPRQYELLLKVGFSVQNRKGELIRPPKQVQVTRQFTSNNDRILGSKDEESILINEMRQDAAIQIINRLSHK